MQRTKTLSLANSLLAISILVSTNIIAAPTIVETAAQSAGKKDGTTKSISGQKTTAQTIKEMMDIDAKEALEAMRAKQQASAPKPLPGLMGMRGMDKSGKPIKAPEPIVVPDSVVVLAVYGNALNGKQARISVNSAQSVVKIGETVAGYKVADVGSGCVVLTADTTVNKSAKPGRFCFSEPQAAGSGSTPMTMQSGERSFPASYPMPPLQVR
jgi:hypothetical protein